MTTIVLTINIQKDFWEHPRIPNETGSSAIGEAIDFSRELELQGYEIVTLMTYKTQSAYFDLLEVDTNLNVEDLMETENNNEKEVDIYIQKSILEMLNSIEKYVIVADQNGILKWNQVSFDDDEFNYKITPFNGGAYAITIN